MLFGFVVDEVVILNHKLPFLVLGYPVIIGGRSIHNFAGVGLVIVVRAFEGFAEGGFLLGLQLVCDTTREKCGCYQDERSWDMMLSFY